MDSIYSAPLCIAEYLFVHRESAMRHKATKLLRQFEPDLLDVAKASKENNLVIFEAVEPATGEIVVLLGINEETKEGKWQVSPVAQMIWDAHKKFAPKFPLIMIDNGENVTVGDPTNEAPKFE
jgi:hypothetical protein